jgi:hypothetical protein
MSGPIIVIRIGGTEKLLVDYEWVICACVFMNPGDKRAPRVICIVYLCGNIAYLLIFLFQVIYLYSFARIAPKDLCLLLDTEDKNFIHRASFHAGIP